MNRFFIGMTVFCVSVLTTWAEPPNVIFFATDDLCDWVGPLGYRQAVTPHMDKLAQRGVTFTNAHCPGTFCAPSRSAIFTGQFASTTGCYMTQVYFHSRPDLKPLQQSFKEGGYATYGAGKLFHHPAGYVDLRAWDAFFVRSEEQKREGWPLNSWCSSTPKTRGNDTPVPEPYPNSAYNRGRTPANRFFLEWGALPNEREEDMADTQRINWACDVPYLDPGGYAIVNRQWRYIHYSDHTEELYDLRKDPHEWYNLAEDAAYVAVKKEMQRSAPDTFAPAGVSKNKLKLVTTGETFHWQSKK